MNGLPLNLLHPESGFQIQGVKSIFILSSISTYKPYKTGNILALAMPIFHLWHNNRTNGHKKERCCVRLSLQNMSSVSSVGPTLSLLPDPNQPNPTQQHVYWVFASGKYIRENAWRVLSFITNEMKHIRENYMRLLGERGTFVCIYTMYGETAYKFSHDDDYMANKTFPSFYSHSSIFCLVLTYLICLHLLSLFQACLHVNPTLEI